ncbi:TetR/AcrR family transcriptional regulator [Nocardia neocaledoniensis]|uniref:TetR/AcrR family transcriptional regulator n=1 Tax=Nocardia neocaledoniensis TaxID=236511 RepID=UPI002453F198|nr:TetR/AcrR family transcriptional regulator [Nocardia neocaledoniensis]
MSTRGPKQRLLVSAITLMCERGVHATGLTDLLAHSRTARGSIYQHFPAGKSELFEQATYAAGRTITALLDDLLATRNPAEAIDGIIDYWEEALTSSDYTRGCPILAAAQAGAQEPSVQAASAVVFTTWTDRIATALRNADADPMNAKVIASTVVSAIEGAIAQSRGARSTQPLSDARVAMKLLIASVIPCR